jgi:hypothetical protein
VGHGQKVYFGFDEQETYKARALETFHEIAAMVPEEVMNPFGGVGFMQRRHAPGLQLADMHVHCWHRYLTDPSSLGSDRKRVMDALTKKGPVINVARANYLGDLLSKLPTEKRVRVRRVRDPGRIDKG